MGLPGNKRSKLMAKIKATLKLIVHYEDESGTMTTEAMLQEAEHLLNFIADNAAFNGLLSGNSEMIVEEWDSSVNTEVKE